MANRSFTVTQDGVSREFTVSTGVGPAGQGVPTGGTTGQVLSKSSNADYATTWTTGGVGDLLASENTWTGTQIFGGGFTVNGTAVFGPLASFTYIESEATHRTALGLGTLATQSGTFSGTSSGTNTGDQTNIVGITGTIAQFNTALTDADFATLAGTETLTNKTLTSPILTTPTLGVASATSLTSSGNITTNGAFLNLAGAPGFWLEENAVSTNGAFVVLYNNTIGIQRRGTGFGGYISAPIELSMSAPSGSVFMDSAGNVTLPVSLATGRLVVGGGTNVGKLRHGNATLVAGTVTVTDTAITANSRIQVNRFTDGGTLGDSYSVTRSAGVSFSITAKTANVTASLETSVITYLIIEP